MTPTTVLRRGQAGITAAALALCLASPASAQRQRVVIPSGTVVPATLRVPLSSKTSRPGDRFTAAVKYGREDAGLPEGTRIEGVVREAIPSADGKPGVLDVDFTRVVLPGGEARPVSASLYGLDAKSVKRTESGRLVATADKGKDRLKWVGIGAGAGLLLSTLTKGNTLTSILLGAGAGYLYNELQNKKPGDVNLKEGAEFGVRFDRQFAFSADRDPRRPDYDRPNDRDRVLDQDRADDPYYRGDRQYRRRDGEPAQDSPRGDIGLLIDDRSISFGSAKPYLRGDAVMVPLAAVAKEGRFDYRYDADDRLITARNGAVRLPLDSRVAVVDGERRRLPAVAEMRNGTLYVPVQFIGAAMKASVAYDKPSRTVLITTHEGAGEF